MAFIKIENLFKKFGSVVAVNHAWLEVKQVVWETVYYEKAFFWINGETFPILQPTLVRTWTECCRPFNPWYHYYNTWDASP